MAKVVDIEPLINSLIACYSNGKNLIKIKDIVKILKEMPEYEK